MDKNKLQSILTKADKLQKGKEVALAKEFLDIDSKISNIEKGVEEINVSVDKKLSDISEELKKKLDEELSYEVDEQKIVESVLEKIPTPKDGEDYVLTEQDKKEIASSIKLPTVEKIIERVEVIKEQPIVTNEIKELAIPIDGEEIVTKINELSTDDEEFKIDFSHIKNAPKQNSGTFYGGSGIKEVIAGNGISVDKSNLGYPVIKVALSQETTADLINESGAIYSYAHGTAQRGDEMFIGTRGSPATITVFTDPNDLSSYTQNTLTGYNNLESLTYDSVNDKLYGYVWNNDSHLRILSINPNDLSFTQVFDSSTINGGDSASITNDGTYVYVVTFTNPAKFVKIRISDWTVVAQNTWTNGNKGHSIGIVDFDDRTEIYAISSMGTSYFAKVNPDDLSYSEVALSINLITDDLCFSRVGNYAYVYLGSEHLDDSVPAGSKMARIKTDTMSVEYFWGKATYVVKCIGNDLYSGSLEGMIIKYPNQDITNPKIFLTDGKKPNELFYAGGKIFFTDWTSGAKLYEVELPEDYTVNGVDSYSIGRGAIASGNLSESIGFNSKVSGDFSIGIGDHTEITGNNSYSLGTNTKVSANNSIAIGNGLKVGNIDAQIINDVADSILIGSADSSGTTQNHIRFTTGGMTFYSGVTSESYISAVDGFFVNDEPVVVWGGNTLGAKKLIGTNDTYDIGFKTDNTERLTILSDGKIGINKDTPTAMLEIVASSNINPLSISGNFNQGGTIRAQSTLNTGYSGMNMYDESGTLSASFAYGNTSANSFTNEFVFASRKSTTALKFYQGGVSAGAERIRIDASANIALLNAKVGIGTTSPATGTLLDVYGSAKIGKGIDSPSKTLTIGGHLNFDRVTNITQAEMNAMTLTNGGAGSIPAGTYYYLVCYYTAEGDTGNINIYSTAPTITLASPSRVTLSNIPISNDPRVIGRKIYRSQAGTVGDYYYLYRIATIADNTTTTFSDNTTTYNSTDWTYNKINTTAGIIYQDGSNVLVRLGDYVTSVGNNALGSLTRGSTCAAFGSSALVNCTTGDSNQAFGHSALSSITIGSSNVAMGYASGLGNQTGSGNVSIGQDSLRNNLSQSYTGNTAVGTQALGILTNGNNYNNAFGYGAGYNAQGSYGLYLGYYAGRQATATSVGSGNIVIGYNAGTALGTGNYNVLIGYDVEIGSPNTSSQLNIGNIIYGTGMGTGSTASATGKVGIGTESLSTSKLTIADNITVKGIASSGTNIDLLTASAEPKIVGKISNTDEWSLGINSTVGSDAVSLFANSKKIILAGNGSALDFETGGGETTVYMGESENAFVVWSNADSNSFIKVDTVNYKTTFNLGDVGIGVDPTAKLDVNSDIIRLRTSKTPASATATGNTGDICWDSSYVYVCVASNTWKRSALSTW